MVSLPRPVQVLRFNQRQIEFVFKARRALGEVWSMHAYRDEDVVTSHPDHVRSLFTARAEDAPSITGESPLRPIVGPNSVLTAIGPRHMRQRKLLLPAFHGEAIEHYSQMISDAAEREVDRWPIGEPLALAPRMQAITLDVIMAGIFGIEGKPARGTPEQRLRSAVRTLVNLSTWKIAQLGELLNLGSDEPVGPTKLALSFLDRPTYQVIAERREAADLGERRDILSMLLQATTEDGETLSDQEVRDELLTLVLAGHETTANSLAWTWERLVRFPEAHERLREAVRAGDGTDEVERVIQEGMRSRPVIPMIGRRVTVPWRLGEYAVPANTPVLMSILLIHHREDLYPDPFAFRPERWEDRKSRHLRLDPVRRRHPPLPGSGPRDGGAARGARDDGPPPRPRGRRPRARARRAPQRHDDPSAWRAGGRALARPLAPLHGRSGAGGAAGGAVGGAASRWLIENGGYRSVTRMNA